jgi:hypothetical protein
MPRPENRAQYPTTLWVALAYLVVTFGMTWPLPAGLTRDVPGDLGDSLLNMWILGWGAEHIPRVVTGQMSLGEFRDANIFHPEPLALGFSEHLFGQVLQILPVYHLTGNLILCYNLLFLSSFVLSGLGMYLLVRDVLAGPDVTNHDRRVRYDAAVITYAAFAAGLLYAFVPLRVGQIGHLQSVSAQWMPLALYGFRRFVFSAGRVDTTGATAVGPASRLALAGGTAALLMQNWSSGYYLVFFAPMVVLFVLHQIITAGQVRNWRIWAWLLVAAAAVGAGTLPFLALYLETQRVHGFERPLGEVIRYSADVYSYFTAPEALRVWGDIMQAYPKPEGELFLGWVPMLLVLIAVLGLLFTGDAMAGGRPGAHGRSTAAASSRFVTVVERVLAVVVLVQLIGFAGILFTGGFVTSVAGVPVRATNAPRLLIGLAIALCILLAVSRRTRNRARAIARSPVALAVALGLLAVWLSLGPLPQSGGRLIQGLGLYALLYEHVPGFDGLRVPARYSMIAAVFLSVAAGYAVALLLRRTRHATIAAAALCVAFLVEAAFVPIPLNQTWGDGGVVPPARIEPAASAPAVYHHLAAAPDARVIVEFPFGDPSWELRSVYYSTVHWKRLVNGYSGGFPRGYMVRVARLQRVTTDPAEAWDALDATGATHAIVRESAYAAGEAEPLVQWLTAHGAREAGRFGTDVLYRLPR